MVISFGGLATGLDTNAIISAIMEVERQPLVRIEKEKEYLASRLEAFSQFESKLNALSSSIGEMNTAEKLGSYATRSGSDDYFSLSVANSSLAAEGSYQLEIVSLAQVEKDVSRGGYSDSNADNFRSGTVTINGTDISIAENSSLNDIRDAINQANRDSDTGVSASTIFDGTNYRMVLTGNDAENNFSVSTSGLRNSDGPMLRFDTTQTAQQAEVILDGINITSNSNRLENAIPGISIDLLRENVLGESTTISVESDFTEITAKMEAFATAYNDISTFISEQEGSDWASDSAFRSVTRNLRNLLITDTGMTGNFTHLVDIGFKTDSKTGVLSIDTSKLGEALTTDYESIEALLNGDSINTGILENFNTYLDQWTDTFNGLYASKKQSHDSTVRSLDQSIERMEMRLEKRELLLVSQFSAMEQLVNNMNATSSYLSQQLSNLPSFGNQQ
jgi:flagellar hook-associated protein 2